MNSARAKFTREQIEQIKLDSREQRVIAADYGVAHCTIGRIKRAESYNERR